MFNLTTVAEYMLSVLPAFHQQSSTIPSKPNCNKINNTRNFRSIDHFLKKNAVSNNSLPLLAERQPQVTNLFLKMQKLDQVIIDMNSNKYTQQKLVQNNTKNTSGSDSCYHSDETSESRAALLLNQHQASEDHNKETNIVTVEDNQNVKKEYRSITELPPHYNEPINNITLICGQPAEEWWKEQHAKMYEEYIKKMKSEKIKARHHKKQQHYQNALQHQPQQQHVEQQYEQKQEFQINQDQIQQQYDQQLQQQQIELQYQLQQQHQQKMQRQFVEQQKQQQHILHPVNDHLLLYQNYPQKAHHNNIQQNNIAPPLNNYQKQYNLQYPDCNTEQPFYTPLQELGNRNNLQQVVPGINNNNNHLKRVQAAFQPANNIIPNNANNNNINAINAISNMNETKNFKRNYDEQQATPSTATASNQVNKIIVPITLSELERHHIFKKPKEEPVHRSENIHLQFRKLVEDLKDFDPATRTNEEKHQELIKKMEIARKYFVTAIFGGHKLTQSSNERIASTLNKHFVLSPVDTDEHMTEVSEEEEMSVNQNRIHIPGVTHEIDFRRSLTPELYNQLEQRQFLFGNALKHRMANNFMLILNGEFRDYYQCGTRILGQGISGCVINGFCKSNNDNTEVAIKSLDLGFHKPASNDYVIHNALVECVALSKSISNPNIVQAHMMFLKNNRLTLVLELMHGSVKGLIEKAKYIGAQFSLGHVVYIAREVLKALSFLHLSVGYFHGDMKCDNILITEDGQIKLSDFGLSKPIHQKFREIAGTTQWMAPEVADEKREGGRASDMWSFGMALIEMIDLDTPANERFLNLDDQEEMTRIIARSKRTPSFSRRNFSTRLHNMMINCIMCLRPQDRYGPVELGNLFNEMISSNELDCCSQKDMANFINFVDKQYYFLTKNQQ